MTKCVMFAAAAACVLVTGCAGIHASDSEGNALSDEVLRVGSKAPRAGEDAIYYILAGELAGQRGEFEVALDNYIKASELTHDVRVIQRATQIALYLKKTDKALETASQWLKQEPNSVEARRLVAMLLLKTGRTDEALEHFTALLSTPGADIENILLDLVKLLSAEVPTEDGLKLMRRLGEQFPNLAELQFATALFAADKGEYQMALNETEKALAAHPDWSRAWLLQAQVMSRMGNSEKAREVIQKAVKRDPSNIRLRLIYSQYLAKDGDLRGAERELKAILARDPGNEDAMLGLAIAQLELGQEEKARRAFERLAESDQRSSQAFFYLGIMEARKNRLQSALEWFDKVRDGPMAFDARVNAITALINLNRTGEARQRLADARKEFPQEALRLYLLEAELLSRMKSYDEAFELLGQALDEMPGQPELLYARALAADHLERHDVMEADLRAVLAKTPNDPNALNALGFSLADRSLRLDEAKGYIEKALAQKPEEPAILDSYGWVQYRLGNYATALEYLRRAYRLLKDPEIGAHLGEVLWESGNRAEAKKIWKELLRKDPDHDDIKKVMARYPEAFR